MSMIHLKTKDVEKTQQILKWVLEKYKDDIASYDIEEIARVNYSDSSVEIESRRALKKGGSLLVTIPKTIAEYLELTPKSQILFILRKRIGRVYLAKPYSLVLEEAAKKKNR